MADRFVKIGAAVALAVLLLAGCGGDDGGDDEGASSSAPAEETTEDTEATEETTEDTTEVTVDVIEPEDTGDSGGAAGEEALTTCLTDLGHTVTAGTASYGADFALLVDGGAAADGSDVYGYADPAGPDSNWPDVQEALPDAAVEIAGQVIFAYPPVEIEVAGDVAECAEP